MTNESSWPTRSATLLPSLRHALAILSSLAWLGLSPAGLHAQTLAPEFSGVYGLRDLGVLPNEAYPSGICIKPGTTNVLLFRQGETAGYPISQINLTRDASGHFNGATGVPTTFATAGGVDGSLVFAPGNVILLTSYNDVFFSQIKSGSTTVDKRTNLEDLGYTLGGSLAIVPQGFPGAGRLKILSVTWYDTTLSSAGDGTFNIAPPNLVVGITNDLTGAIYVQGGTPGFATDSVLVAEGAETTVAAYRVDANGDPILASKRSFITGQGLPFMGATEDPATKDFLFAGFNRHLYLVGRFGATAPTVTITEPAPGATFLSSGGVALTAQASQPNGSIARVVFYLGTNLAATVTEPPYTAGVGPLQAGNYALTAVAYAGSGLSVTSSVVNFTVSDAPPNVPPVVTWANPATNVSLVACTSITLRANASDPDRPTAVMQKVEFLLNGVKLGEVTREPYTYLWTDLGVGNFSLTVRATDIDGGVTTSSPIVATVTEPKPNTLGARFTSPQAPRFPALCLGGFLGRNYVLEATTNYVDWVTVTNIASTNMVTQFVDTQSPGFSARYFRVRLSP